MRREFSKNLSGEHIPATRRFITEDAVVEKIDGRSVVSSKKWALGHCAFWNGRTTLDKENVGCEITKTHRLLDTTVLIKQRFAQLAVAEATTERLLVFMSLDDPRQPFSCHILANLLIHLYQDELSPATINLVEVEYRVTGRSTASKRIEHQRLLISSHHQNHSKQLKRLWGIKEFLTTENALEFCACLTSAPGKLIRPPSLIYN